jgi:hypothetical protein
MTYYTTEHQITVTNATITFKQKGNAMIKIYRLVLN